MKKTLHLLLLLVFSTFYSLTYAATIESVASGSWNTTSTWAGGVVPGAGDDVVIKPGHNVVVNSFDPVALCDTLTIQPEAIFRLGGFLNQSGAVLNFGTLTWSSGTFEGTGVITNDGTLNINGVLGFFPLHNTAADIVNNPGKTINWNGGGLDVGSGQTLTNHGIFNLIGNNPDGYVCEMGIVNTGIIIKQAGTLTFTGAFDNQTTGSVNGQGTLTFLSSFSNAGSISPGLSPGNLTLNRTSGVQVHDLEIEIASNAGPGTGHDRLQSSNAVSIGGDLTVSLLGGFEPDEGATYTIMTYASRTGVFASVTPDCWTVTYGATSATVTYEPSYWYADEDGDGYGNAVQSLQSCTAPSGYVSNNTDCDDTNPNIYPGAPEICDGLDNDCNGQTDEGNICDGDGDGYTIAQGDCDDANPAIYPGAPELCNDIDDDCDGQTDEGALLTFYADADGDSYGNAAVTTQACTAPSGYVSNNTDCNDGNAAVNPGATETCNGIDDDCNGQTDEGAPDSDGDGICNALDNCPNTYNPDQADNEGDGIGDVCDNNDDNDPKLDHQDCAPFNPNIYSGAPEICGNLIDDDCDNKIDELLGIQTISEQDVLCNGQATGSITVTGTCGLPPYTYLWTNGETTATISNLTAGSYKVTVTDAQGLTKTKNHNITQPSALNVNMTTKDVKCFGGSDGTATASPSGGKSPYTYAWNNGGITKTISGLSVGAYIVTVTDANGCTKIGGIEVNQPTELVITGISSEPDVLPGKYKITVTAAGGTPYDDGYRYRRCNAGGTGCTGWQVSNVLLNVPAGTYLVRVKDKNACEASQLVTVDGAARGSSENAVLFENQNMESRTEPSSEFEIRLYPNPASTVINVFVSGKTTGESVFEITDFTGKTVRRVETQPVPGELTQLDLLGLQPGAYLLRWSVQGEMLGTKTFIVVQQ